MIFDISEQKNPIIVKRSTKLKKEHKKNLISHSCQNLRVMYKIGGR